MNADLQLQLKPIFTLAHNGNRYYIDNCIDCTHTLYTLPKDRPFGKLRQDLYFAFLQECYKGCDYFTAGDMVTSYTKEKNNSKSVNGRLQEELYNSGGKELSKILEGYNIVRFNRVPKEFTVKVTDARFVRYDGNEMWVLAEAPDCYYYFEYSGS